MAMVRQFAPLLGVLCLALASPALADPDVFPSSSRYALTSGDLSRLNCNGLWHARNEIYARNGFRFQTARGQAEFGTNGWTSNPPLNPVEQANIALIQRSEARLCP